MGKSHTPIPKSEYYTNLILVTVVEAMVLLIGQLAIFNLCSVATVTAVMWTVVLPVLFYTSLAVTAILVILTVVKRDKISTILPFLKFFVYFTVLISIMRYIPNQVSTYKIPGSSEQTSIIVNLQRGQKIGAVASVIYVAASFLYYTIASFKLDSSSKKRK